MSTENLLKLLNKGLTPFKREDFLDNSPKELPSNKEETNYSAEVKELENELLRIKKPSQYQLLEFDNPIEFAMFFHPALSSFTTFHEWQAWALTIATLKEWGPKQPLELYLVASNGSGKDSYFIAILSMFLLCCKRRNLVVVTTSDGKQLYNQTFPNLSLFAEAINKKLRETGFSTGDEDFIEVKLGSISCSQTGGLIKAFVTDDPGRAEGYHPWADEPESQLTLIINEGKTVSASIFQAFRRCNPYTRYIAVSSTGPDSGYFYEHAIKAVTYPEKLNLKKPYTRYVTSYDCPHVDKELIERDKEELEPWLFDSIHMSRFSSLGGCFCIPSNVILANTFSKDSPSYNDSDYSVGLDLSMGGDETGLVVRKGPFIVSENYFREQNANLLESAILMTIENLDLPDGTMVFADVGGIGKPIISHLREKYPRLQWIEVANQGAARNTSLYLNAGVEDYFHYRNLLEKSLVPAPSKEDTKLFTQLTSRRYVIHKQKYRLEEKKEARNRGERSPDRADARVLAYRRYRCRGGVYVEPTKKVEQKVLISATAPDLEDKLLEAIRSRELPTKGVQGRQTSASAIYRHLC